MSINRSIVIGEQKEPKQETKKKKTSVKKKVAKEALTPVGIVRDKSIVATSMPPEQRKPRVYNPDGNILVIV